VTVTGRLDGCVKRLEQLRALEDGTPIAPARVRFVKQGEESAVLSVVIHQGLNRQVRRMCAQAGLTVHRLKRVREGSLPLDRTLKPGEWRNLTPQELLLLKDEGRKES